MNDALLQDDAALQELIEAALSAEETAALAEGLGGGQVLVMIAILAFFLERVVSGAMLLISLSPWGGWLARPGQTEENGASARSRSLYKVVYACIAGAVAALVVVFWREIRFFEALGYPVHPVLDALLTLIVLVGGADILKRLLKIASGDDSPEKEEPVEIHGKLVIEERAQQQPTE